MPEGHDHRLDVNQASEEELVDAGLFPPVAARIVRHREAHGPIRDETELYQLVRDNEIRFDQLLGLVDLGHAEPRQGYSS